MGVPIWRLTRPVSAATIPAALPAAVAVVPRGLEVDFAGPPPASFELKQLEQVALQGAGPAATFHGQWPTRLPKEGVDLVLAAHWAAADAPAAARVSVTYPGGQRIEKTFWAPADGSLVEIVNVPGSPDDAR